MNIGQSLTTVRNLRGLRQNEAASGIGISQTYLSMIEHGNKTPTIGTLELISAYYEIPMPLLVWYALDEKDIQPRKIEAWRLLKPSVDSFIVNLLEK